MPKSKFLRGQNALAARWRSLAERRRLHLLELQRNGHWRRYYSEESLMEQIRDSEHCARIWATLMDDADVSTTAGGSAVIDGDGFGLHHPPQPAVA